MTLTMILASLLCLTAYLLMGMVLAHYTKLGSKYYPNSLVRLTFFWIVLVVGLFIWFVGMLIICIISDAWLFGDKTEDPGLTFFVDR